MASEASDNLQKHVWEAQAIMCGLRAHALSPGLPHCSAPSCLFSNMVDCKSSSSWNALSFLLLLFTSKYYYFLALHHSLGAVPAPSPISINWILKSKWKKKGRWCYILHHSTSIWFENCIPLPLRKSKSFSPFKKEVCAGAKFALVAAPNYIQDRHLLAKVENEKKRKESAGA